MLTLSFASELLLLLPLSGLVLSKPVLKAGSHFEKAALSKRFLDVNAISTSFPDPCVIQIDGISYVFATDNGNFNVPNAQNSDFTNGAGWQLSPTDAFPTLGSWVTPGDVGTQLLWAPDVNMLDDGSFIMYYSAVSSATGQHCLGVATSASVTGPYVDNNTEALYCPDTSTGGAIDSSGFLDSDGTRYMVYKLDGPNAGNPSTPLILQPMTSDGQSFNGDAITLMDNAGDSDGNNVEAPAIVRSSDATTYFLFFSSGSTFGDTYTLSYASSTNGVGGTYGNRQVLLDSSSNVCGQTFLSPGGADVTLVNANIVFHQGIAGSEGGRPMSTASIAFDGSTVSIVC